MQKYKKIERSDLTNSRRTEQEIFFLHHVDHLLCEEPIPSLRQLMVFGCLETYFVMKAAVRSGDADLMIKGVLEMEKIFFFKTTIRNYQLAAF